MKPQHITYFFNQKKFIKSIALKAILVFALCTTNTNAQTQAPSIRTGVTFQWEDSQTISGVFDNNNPATIASVTIDGTIYNTFVVPSGYQLTRLGPDGDSENAIRNNGAPFTDSATASLDITDSTSWDDMALAAFQDKNLNHYFESNDNGDNICEDFDAANGTNGVTETDAQVQTIFYDPAIPSNSGGILAETERGGNNCFYVRLIGTLPGDTTEQVLGDTFVRNSGNNTGGSFNAPVNNLSDYWGSGREQDNGQTICVALFTLNDIAPTGSRITRIEFLGASNDHGDGKFFLLQSYAQPQQDLGCINEAPFNGKIDNSATAPEGSTYTLVSGPTPAGLSFSLNSDGTYSYTPTPGYQGDVTFEYELCLPAPNDSVCDTSTVTLTYDPLPEDPVVVINCNGSGGVDFEVASPLGAEYEYSINNGTFQSSTTFSGLPLGTYEFMVRNSTSGCVNATATSIQLSDPVDQDGVYFVCDEDDDNDGILDIDEGLTCPSAGIGSTEFPEYTYNNCAMVTGGTLFSNIGLFEGVAVDMFVSQPSGASIACGTGDLGCNSGDNGFTINNSDPGTNINISFFENNTSNPVTINWALFLDDFDENEGIAINKDNLIAYVLNDNNNTTVTDLGTQLDFDSGSDSDDNILFYFKNVSQITITFTHDVINRDVCISSASGSFPSNPVCNALGEDFDGDSLPNHLDIDSDNDGIPDNVEGQPTVGYVTPTGPVNNITGILSVYNAGLTPTDTDNDQIPDFLDLDSDNDGTPDIEENGMANAIVTFTDTDGDGLDDLFEGANLNDALDLNDEINNPSSSILPDADGDVLTGGDLDYRDATDFGAATIDFDGIDDYVVGDSVFSGFNQSNTNGVTLMAWIKSESDVSDANQKFVFGEDESIELFITDEDIRAYIYTVSSTGVNQTDDVYRTTSGIVRNRWRHVSVTVDFANNEASLYLDGDWVFTTNLNDAVKFQSADTVENETFRLGNDSSLISSRFFKGAIDEVRVFNTLIPEDDIKAITFQEIENESGSVKGSVINNTISSANWSNLQLYYPMTNIQGGKVIDESQNDNNATLFNITTIQPQTAPMPYTTKQDGLWSSKDTWTHGDVWFIPGDEVLEDAIFGNDEAVHWGIYHIKNNVTLNTSMSEPNISRGIQGIEALGIIVDEQDDSNNDITFTIGDGSEDLQVNISKYLELNGTLDLQDDSQLIQTQNSDLVTSSDGKILRRQEGNTDVYWYNYWASPVGTTGATTLSNNNGSSNNTNNSTFNLSMLKDGNGDAIEFTSSFNEVGNISTSWLYTFQNGLTYWDWVALNPSSTIQPGFGYTQKGTGNAGAEQQYIFEGKPNNGTILIAADDVDGDDTNESQQDITMTTSLIGNPYPSALDARQFIADNNGIIQGTILLWEQWAGSSHLLAEYEGGYGYINAMTTARAYQHPDIPIADQVQTQGIKTPSFYIPVAQGFFVEVVNDGDIEFNNGQRVFIKESDANSADPNDGSVFFRANDNSNTTLNGTTENTEVNPFQLMRFEFNTSEGASRHFVLGFSDTATDGFDYGLDGGLVNNIPEDDMATVFEDKQYVIQAYAPITSDKVVDLNFNASGNHNYSLKIVEFTNVPEDQEVYLKDHLTGTLFDLRQGQEYQFTSSPGQFTDRFDVVFQGEDTLSNNAIDNTSNVLIYMNNTVDKLFVKGLTQQAQSLTLINTLGQRVKKLSQVTNTELENGINITDIASGVYIVNLTTNDYQSLTKKIILE